MPVVCRPFSVNAYALSKVWFRTHSVDLRMGDIRTIKSQCKSYVYQDMLEKPSELVLYRKVEDGGLGLHHCRCKALASLITTFLQTASNPRFQQSLYHNCLFRYYCLGEVDLPKPELPPYYSQQFFDTIRKVIQDTPLNPIHMSLKQWYYFLLEEEVTMEVVNEVQTKKVSRVEALHPDNPWENAYHFSRLKGLPTETRSFNFKLLQGILPVSERSESHSPKYSP